MLTNLKSEDRTADKTLGMSNTQNWVEALNINPENLTQWSAEAPEGKPLLVHCLEAGYVSASEYFQWACEHFGLAILDAAYFDQSYDRSLLDLQKDHEVWEPWFFPVAYWDNTIFVACVEPPADEPENGLRFVLADPRAMALVWQQKEDAPPIDLPDGIKLDLNKTFTLNLENASFAPQESTNHTPTQSSLSVSQLATVTNEISLSIPTPQTQSNEDESEDKSAHALKPLMSKGDKASSEVFEILKSIYEHAFIMQCSDEQATLFEWDSDLHPSNKDQACIKLSTPSFVRIVTKTLRPYHGYLIDSPAHHELFSSLGIQKIPECVTAVPLKIDERLWGILIATGGKSLQNLDYLRQVELLGQQLIKTAGPSWAPAA